MQQRLAQKQQSVHLEDIPSCFSLRPLDQYALSLVYPLLLCYPWNHIRIAEETKSIIALQQWLKTFKYNCLNPTPIAETNHLIEWNVSYYILYMYVSRVKNINYHIVIILRKGNTSQIHVSKYS